MIGGDLINGALEFGGGIFLTKDCLALYHAKKFTGVYAPARVFFAVWGIWNLIYYPSLGQWLSFTGGCFIVTANLIWVAMAIHYSLNRIET